nr:hypothetical protein [Clostridia bacterium]
MKKTRRILSMLLALASLSAAFAASGCSADNGSTDVSETTAQTSDTAAETTVTETEPARENTPDSLPELDFEGAEYNLFYRDSDRYRDDVIGEQGGDIVKDAVYRRNLEVEERLNIKFNLIPGPEGASPYCTQLKTTVLAGEDAYDLVSAYQAFTLPYVLENCFANLYDAEYLDFSQPWWDVEYMTEILVGDDNLYFLMGDIALMMIKSMSVVYFNKAIYEGTYGDPAEFYEKVENGEWYFDEFHRMSDEIYSDLNGNGTADLGDMFGFAANTGKSTEHFMYDAGMRSSNRDSDGIPQINVMNERNIEFFEAFYKLYYENAGAYITPKSADLDTTFLQMFMSDNLLFLPEWFYTSELLRDMETDYGMIPFPKFDEQQEDYLSLVHDGTTIYCIPITVGDLDFAAAVAEALAAESYRVVTPAFYEVALKTKYTRDDVSSRIIDMIYNSATTDFLYANNYSLNSTMVGLICRTLAVNETADLASEYAKIEVKAQAALDALIDAYNEIN